MEEGHILSKGPVWDVEDIIEKIKSYAKLEQRVGE